MGEYSIQNLKKESFKTDKESDVDKKVQEKKEKKHC